MSGYGKYCYLRVVQNALLTRHEALTPVLAPPVPLAFTVQSWLNLLPPELFLRNLDIPRLAVQPACMATGNPDLALQSVRRVIVAALTNEVGFEFRLILAVAGVPDVAEAVVFL